MMAIVACMPVLTLVSCYKEKNTVAEVVVQDIQGKPVEGASVRLFCKVTNCTVDLTQTTESNGSATFKFKPGTEALLWIEAKKGSSTNGPNDYGNFEQRKTTTVTVTITP